MFAKLATFSSRQTSILQEADQQWPPGAGCFVGWGEVPPVITSTTSHFLRTTGGMSLRIQKTSKKTEATHLSALKKIKDPPKKTKKTRISGHHRNGFTDPIASFHGFPQPWNGRFS